MASDLIFHHVFHGSLSISEMHKERRPYHKNCSCGLHNLGDAPHVVCLHHMRVACPKRQSGNNGSLSIEGFSCSPHQPVGSSNHGKTKDHVFNFTIRR
ncbi:hypothetical protein R6Q57_009843 [Mikania cordata]